MEYQFLNDKTLYLLKKSFIICELHPFLIEQGKQFEKKLILRASKYFKVRFLKRTNYNPDKFIEFSNLSDNERLIALAEGRPQTMRWLVLTPKF